MKTISADTVSSKDNIDHNSIAMSLANKQISKKKWMASAAIFAFLLFVLLNLLPLAIHSFGKERELSDNSEKELFKLRQLILESPYEADKSGPWPWWVARAYFKSDNPDIVAMGDSQMNAAFIQADAMTMKKYLDCTVDRSCIALRKALQKNGYQKNETDVRTVNLALGGAMPSDYYLMSKAFFTPKHHPKIVIIGISPRSFVDSTLTSASATETFQFLASSVDMGSLTNSAFPNPIEGYFWILRNKFTLFSFQQDIELAWRDVVDRYFAAVPANKKYTINSNETVANGQALQSIYAGNGFMPMGSNMVGPNARIPFRANKPEYERRFSKLNTNTLAAQSTYFDATLKYLNQLGVQIIVVDMPMLQPVRELLPNTFWNTYRFILKHTCRENNANLLELSESKDFPQDEFIDYVHLNATGGKHFADKLANYIKDNTTH